MKLFKKRVPTIDAVEVHAYVQDLERLSKLRDKTQQMARLYQNDSTDYQAEADRYTIDIEMAQRVLAQLQDGSLKSK
jgi:hypothetical protein